MRFLHRPDIPHGKVRLCAVSAGQRNIARGLARLGAEALEIPPHPELSAPVAAHADLQIRDLGGGRLLAAPGCAAVSELEARGFHVETIKEPLSPEYPGDTALCCIALGGRLYGNPEGMASGLAAAYGTVRAVRQGYARCSACIVDENAAITADKGIAAALEADGVSVLRIRPGYIELPGYTYGFIGGCAGLLDRGLLAFAGDISLHPDGAVIREFCRGRGVDIVCLAGGSLTDIGGILPLMEEQIK